MKPKVLKTAAEHAAALKRIDALMDAKPGSPQEAELELWAVLVEKFEDAHHPIAAPDPIAAIRFRMEQDGLRPNDLVPFLQSKSKVSEVLNRKRPLSLAMIRSLHYGLKIPSDALLCEDPAPYKYGKPAKARR
jgi:HTH-type transcriptional regulator/antitoxin HigA